METERRFHWADYLVFSTSLGFSLVIGIYYAFKERKQSSTDNYLMGGREMGVLPVAASLVVTMVSAIFVLGVPAEIYDYGMYYTMAVIGYVLALLISSSFYHPVFHRLRITSVYEYLEMRYCKEVRIACSTVTMIQMLCYASVALYAPTIAISQATGLPYWACIVIFATLCTAYTTLGGFKTVLWTDTLQCGIMLIGMAATLIKGSVDVGGLRHALDIADKGGRLKLTNMVPSPMPRHTVWNWLFGDFCFYMSMYAGGQFAVQRFCSVKTVNKARLAMACAIPIYGTLITLASLLGCLAYAYYNGCDPYLSGRILTRDQTMALLVIDVFEHYPGMAGVFLASVMSAALSTLSSVQNSFAAILLQDVLRPLKLKITGKAISEQHATIASKIIALLVGVAIMLLAIVVSMSGKLVMTLSSATLTLGAGPVLGVFTIGLFMPFGNSKGALSGLISGILLLGWVIIGSLTIPKTLQPPLPVSDHLCPVHNSTTVTPPQILGNTSLVQYDRINSTAVVQALNLWNTSLLLSLPDNTTMISSSMPAEASGIEKLYRVSFSWYAFIGAAPSIIVGVIVSLLTGGKSESVRGDLLFSFKRDGPHCRVDRTKQNELKIKDGATQSEKGTMLHRNVRTDI